MLLTQLTLSTCNMEHYVTLFNSLFLPQGLALHMSMERHIGEYTLWILCVDDTAHEVLSKLELSNVRLLKLSDLETEELKRVKQDRTIGEYCWTLTPFTPRFVFDADSTVNRVTYLDADLWFRKKPNLIFREFEASEKYVLITDHAYAADHDHSATSGQYCVQFMTFKRGSSENVRKWWEERCIEWCYSRFENGKFGDQKYLDDWPERFERDVHVLNNKELTLAPWNATRFPYSSAVFYHFHGLRILSDNKILKSYNYKIPNPTLENLYTPYIKDIKKALDILNKKNHIQKPQSNITLLFIVSRYVKKIIKNFLI